MPFTVRGTGGVAGGGVQLDASGSSQFVSGLLLSGARFDDGLEVEHRGARLPSLPHIDMTVDALARRGVAVDTTLGDGSARWTVPAHAIAGRDLTIEPDLSNAAPFLAAALIGYLAERGETRNLATSVAAMALGSFVIYAVGATWLAHELGIPLASGDPNAIALGVTPFLIGDAIKMLLAGALLPVTWKLLDRGR